MQYLIFSEEFDYFLDSIELFLISLGVGIDNLVLCNDLGRFYCRSGDVVIFHNNSDTEEILKKMVSRSSSIPVCLEIDKHYDYNGSSLCSRVFVEDSFKGLISIKDYTPLRKLIKKLAG